MDIGMILFSIAFIALMLYLAERETALIIVSMLGLLVYIMYTIGGI